MIKMEILPNIKICGKALCLEKHNALVFSDLQLGYEQHLMSKGYMVPKFQLEDIKRDFEKIIAKRKFLKIIINGDFKHEFGRISEQEWREALSLIDYLTERCEQLIFIKGNHDNFLPPIARKRDILLVDDLVLDDIYLLHGDRKKVIPKGIKLVILGHEHPALGLRRGSRMEKYKCFLKGKYNKYDLIILPSFNPLVEGSDILKEKFISPFIPKSINAFEIYAIEDNVYYFGSVKSVMERISGRYSR